MVRLEEESLASICPSFSSETPSPMRRAFAVNMLLPQINMFLWTCCAQEAVKCKIHRTVHAGEAGPASKVKEVSSPSPQSCFTP